MKKLIQWLLLRKVRNAAGELEAKGVSITKVCACAIGLMQLIEFASPYFGHTISFDQNIYAGIASIGGIALKEGVDRSSSSPSPKT